MKILANLKLGLQKCVEIGRKLFAGPFGVFFDPVDSTQVPYDRAIGQFWSEYINGHCTMTYLAVVDFEVLIFPDFFVVAFVAAGFGDLAKGTTVDVISSPSAESSTKALSAVVGSAGVIVIGVAA
jgi:hypothetical protein